MRASGRLAGKILSGRVYPEVFPIAPNERVVNLGCGAGPQAVVYKGHYARMVGVDVNAERLRWSRTHLAAYGVGNEYQGICANVERVPLSDRTFDKAIAIDIIEHVQQPEALCAEAYRLLRPGGTLLITFPVQHDRFTHAVHMLGAVLPGRNKRMVSAAWNPDAHNSAHGFGEWNDIVERAGFRRVRWKASTLFPPLHLYGVPRFWFSSETIHWFDAALCRLPAIRRLGQSAVAVYARVP
jgi:ubiquinone/menaquinone biosynthesis C-methylase UbiE